MSSRYVKTEILLLDNSYNNSFFHLHDNLDIRGRNVDPEFDTERFLVHHLDFKFAGSFFVRRYHFDLGVERVLINLVGLFSLRDMRRFFLKANHFHLVGQFPIVDRVCSSIENHKNRFVSRWQTRLNLIGYDMMEKILDLNPETGRLLKMDLKSYICSGS